MRPAEALTRLLTVGAALSGAAAKTSASKAPQPFKEQLATLQKAQRENVAVDVVYGENADLSLRLSHFKQEKGPESVYDPNSPMQYDFFETNEKFVVCNDGKQSCFVAERFYPTGVQGKVSTVKPISKTIPYVNKVATQSS